MKTSLSDHSPADLRSLLAAVLVGAVATLAIGACSADESRQLFHSAETLPESQALLTAMRFREGFHRTFAGVMDDSTVWVANGDPPVVVGFTAVGVERSRIGRGGSGPGEFGRVLAVDYLGPDTLVFIDAGLSRVSTFLTDGRLVRSYPVQLPLYSSLGKCNTVSRALRCVVRRSPEPRAIPEGGSSWDSLYVGELLLSGDSILTVARLTSALPGSPVRRIADDASVRLVRDEDAFDTFMDLRDPIQAIPSGGGSRLLWQGDAWEETPFASGIDVVTPFPRSLDDIPKRLLAAAIRDDEGLLWLAANDSTQGTREWIRLNATGAPTERTRLPASFRPWQARGRRILGRVSDSLGVVGVVVVEVGDLPSAVTGDRQDR